MEVFTFREVYIERVYEQEADFIPAAGWTVFDLGANIGVFTIQQALRGAHVYAFEPNPDCFRRLSRTVRENELDRHVRLFNDAVGAAPGMGVLEVPNGWSVHGIVRPRAESAPNGEPAVTITALDSIMPSLGVARIDLLKIDVEGAEVDVLRGATQTLSLVERLIVEYHSPELREKVTALLHSHGFTSLRHVKARNADTGAGVLYARKESHVE
jgi:FkbM family methyltransferase